MLRARRGSTALNSGRFNWLPSPKGVLAWERVADDDSDRRAVLVNFTPTAVDVVLPGDWAVDVATDAALEGRPYAGRLGPDAAAVLRRQPEKG